MRSTLLTLAFVAAALVANAAPVPKEKLEPLPAITDKQLAESVQKLKQMGIAWHNFESVNGRFPNNVLKEEKPLLSWRVAILPYLEEEELYKQFKLDEAWDSENNKKLIAKMPKIFQAPRGRAKAGETFYQSFTGADTILGARILDITDGTSNTLMIAEAETPVVWSKPDDLPFDGKTPPKLGGMFDGDFNTTFADGSVRKFKRTIKLEILMALITRNGGEVVNVDGE